MQVIVVEIFSADNFATHKHTENIGRELQFRLTVDKMQKNGENLKNLPF